jgi:hypothetical protein
MIAPMEACQACCDVIDPATRMTFICLAPQTCSSLLLLCFSLSLCLLHIHVHTQPKQTCILRHSKITTGLSEIYISILVIGYSFQTLKYPRITWCSLLKYLIKFHTCLQSFKGDEAPSYYPTVRASTGVAAAWIHVFKFSSKYKN